MIAYASKKKKSVREELLHLRALAADWKVSILVPFLDLERFLREGLCSSQEGQEPDRDPALFGKKSKTKPSASDIPARAVGPSYTQLDLIRTIVYGFVAHRYVDKKLEYSDKDYGSSSVKLMEEFLQRSFFYKYLLNYTGTILQACNHSTLSTNGVGYANRPIILCCWWRVQMIDLADLWYREFYLEMGKCLQFPIEMSLPWILTNEILESRNSTMMEVWGRSHER